ncbi:MAG: hypothetical protein C4518_09465 [Desulfobacteraceae bacterium]|nr:MAG: hypothetical protein C4518_09465 [Desulfobacteraceae bacterium]
MRDRQKDTRACSEAGIFPLPVLKTVVYSLPGYAMIDVLLNTGQRMFRRRYFSRIKPELFRFNRK